MTSNEYDKPPELYDGLRLHQNENTAGCSPRVLAALRSLRPEQIGFYPPYLQAIDAYAKQIGVDPRWIAFTNGLDEGIMAAAIVYLRASGGGTPEAIVPQPAFEIFEVNTSVAGGRTIRIPPRHGFAFALDELVAAITSNTRLVFVTNPNNPTGVSVPIEAIKAIARRMPSGGVVFVDEAYADFAGRSFVPELGGFANVIVGRTFAKAYGLAGLRLGALIGSPAALDPVRRAIGVYSVNIAAVVAVQAALEDRAFVADYLDQVKTSKALVYEACERLGVEYWKSDANFVLIRVGDGAGAIVEAAASRGIYLRDRSSEAGCAGCIRMTTGIVDHTRRGLAVLEEVLCAAR
jgi:histidinol-phosphate aminotransferase